MSQLNTIYTEYIRIWPWKHDGPHWLLETLDHESGHNTLLKGCCVKEEGAHGRSDVMGFFRERAFRQSQ